MQPSFNIVYSTGCIVNSLCINDKNIGDINKDELKYLTSLILEEIKKQVHDGIIPILGILELIQPDEIKYSEPCEQCFDSICVTKWNL